MIAHVCTKARHLLTVIVALFGAALAIGVLVALWAVMMLAMCLVVVLRRLGACVREVRRMTHRVVEIQRGSNCLQAVVTLLGAVLLAGGVVVVIERLAEVLG